MATVMLLDGHSLAYRAFFALPTDMATASGQVTNAVFGFTSMLINLLKDHRPDAIAVTFDRPEPTFRHALVPDYKAGRAETPDILRQQMGLVRKVVETLKIPIVEAVGFEADDVIATLATRARNSGDDVIVVTGDRDAWQLVEDPHVRVLYNRRGVSDYVLYDESAILERTGVPAALYPQYAALRGDPSDNLPGVPGVGEKTAARLLNDFGDLDGVFAHMDKCTPKLAASLEVHEAQVRLNAKATPLIRDVPLDLGDAQVPNELRMGTWQDDEVKALFTFLEFRSLWDRLLAAVRQLDGVAGDDVVTDQGALIEVELEEPVDVASASAALKAVASAAGTVGLAGAWTGVVGRSPMAGLALASAGNRVLWLGATMLGHAEVKSCLDDVVGRDADPVATHDAKQLIRGLWAMGVDFRAIGLDSAVAAYLVEPGDAQYPLDDLALRYAGLRLQEADAPPPGQLDLSSPTAKSGPVEGAARRAVAVVRLGEKLGEALVARGLDNLYQTVERPLIRVLARMEDVGVGVDRQALCQFNDDMISRSRSLEAEIQGAAGEPFNVNSTLQIRYLLFDVLGLQPQKKTKTGFSTDAASLEKLRGQHPVIELLLAYREVEKLRSTYGESLLAEVAADGRIHATFNQTVARTGRLSSDRPNLHNIPVRTEEGRRIRRAFIPSSGHRFLVADYNQIELRVIAHLAQDPGLIEAFAAGEDIHRTTAARIFGCDPAGVTIAQRSKAKMVSYGLAYGMEAYGLGQRLGIPTQEAAVVLEAYFEAFPSVRAYMERTVAEARHRGYTETLFGRRRQIPELSSTNFRLRQAGERQAMNAGIQGLAADIFKVALIRLDGALDDAGLRSRLVLQVHDEVIVEVPPEEETEVHRLTLDAMQGACRLSVPLEVNVSWGDSWAAAKG